MVFDEKKTSAKIALNHPILTQCAIMQFAQLFRQAHFSKKTGVFWQKSERKTDRKTGESPLFRYAVREGTLLVKVSRKNYLFWFTHFAAHIVLDWNVPTKATNLQGLHMS